MDVYALAGLAGTFLGDLDESARAALLADATLTEVPRGQPIFADSAEEPRVAFVLEGSVRAYLPGPTGRQLTVRHSRAGALVAANYPRAVGRRANVRFEAATPCALVELNVATLDRLQDTSPRVGAAVTVEANRALEDVYRAFAAATFATVRERLAAHLLDAAETPSHGGLAAPVTQQEMADALGTAREVVGRTLKELQRDGYVRTARRGVELADPSGLAKVAGRWWRPARTLAIDESRPEASFDGSPLPVIAIDRAAEIVYANASVEATFGWRPRQLVGHSIERLLPEEICEAFRAAFDTFMRNVGPGPLGLGAGFHGRRADGSLFPAEITILPVGSRSGQLVFATIVDTSYRSTLRSLLSSRRARRRADRADN